uniref:Uncharacterized protein n=1 Tax=Cacopsylla melanoneura TaxID=428564 RepID=A0A8D8W0K5_9HEMI
MEAGVPCDHRDPTDAEDGADIATDWSVQFELVGQCEPRRNWRRSDRCQITACILCLEELWESNVKAITSTIISKTSFINLMVGPLVIYYFIIILIVWSAAVYYMHLSRTDY